MMTPELLIPFYCRDCLNLIFLVKRAADPGLLFLEYGQSGWKHHSCYNRNQRLTQEDAHFHNISQLEWGVQKLPFLLRESSHPVKQRQFALGVIISIATQEEKNRLLRVISPENVVVEVKTKYETSELSAGVLIDLSEMVRVGPGKFRLMEIIQIVLPADLDQHASSEEYYQMTLSATDQEQLEAFINRLLKNFRQQKFSPINLVPLKISHRENQQLFHRQINLRLESGLLKKIENIPVPESIHLSIRQINT